MISPLPVSISPWLSRPSLTIRLSSLKPNAAASHSIAAGPSWYEIMGTTPCIADIGTPLIRSGTEGLNWATAEEIPDSDMVLYRRSVEYAAAR
jgi:hypothetical protein